MVVGECRKPEADTETGGTSRAAGAESRADGLLLRLQLAVFVSGGRRRIRRAVRPEKRGPSSPSGSRSSFGHVIQFRSEKDPVGRCNREGGPEIPPTSRKSERRGGGTRTPPRCATPEPAGRSTTTASTPIPDPGRRFYAKESGRVRLLLASPASRPRSSAGRGGDMSDVDNVLIAAAACELHPKRPLLKGIEMPIGQGPPANGEPARRSHRASPGIPRRLAGPATSCFWGRRSAWRTGVAGKRYADGIGGPRARQTAPGRSSRSGARKADARRWKPSATGRGRRRT